MPSRPHAKTHKCAAIAKMQLAAGAIGICTAKLSEAEALVAARHRPDPDDDGQPVGEQDSPRDGSCKKRIRDFIQAVDYEQNARDLSDAAKEAGVVADVVIDVAVGTRSGIPAGRRRLALAQLVDKLPNLKLRGLLSYDGGAQHINGFADAQGARAEEHRAERRARSRR